MRRPTHFLLLAVLSLVGIDRAAAFSATELTVTTAEGVTLGATLTLPDARPTASAVPGVLLVAGSGPNDRDERVTVSDGGAYSPLRVIAETLSDAGFAVLRYDKRTCAPANGHPHCTSNLARVDVPTLTIQDFRDDALAALRVLKAHPGVRRTGLAVIGHSQGATPVAPMVCATDLDVSHCVLLMGHGVPIDEVMVRQYTALGQTVQASSYSSKFAALRQKISASPLWRWPLDGDPTMNRAQLAASVADVNPMPDGSTSLFWATWIRATETTALRDTLGTFTRRGGRLLSVNSVDDFNCDVAEFQPLRGLVSELGGTAVVMDNLLHILAPTPLTRAGVAADPSPVCSTLLTGLTAFLSVANGGKPQHSGDREHGWPPGQTAPCGNDALSPMQCEQCADAGVACTGSQQASFALLLSSAESQISAECQDLFRLMLGAQPAVSVDSPELCELGCWEAAYIPRGCEDSVCDCTLGAGDATYTIAAAAALCESRPPSLPPSPEPGTPVLAAYCEAVSTGGMVVAACQHGRCTETVNGMGSPSLVAAIAGVNLDAALSAYPCTPCNYAVADLDDLDPAAEESIGAALKERLAYSAAVVVFDCGPSSPVEYEMLFTLPDLALAGFHVGARGAVGLPLNSLGGFQATCDGEAGASADALLLPAECAPTGSNPTDGSDGAGATGPNGACGPVALAVAMQFLNACNSGDFALARCAFSPAVAAAVDTNTLRSLYAGHACAHPTGFRVEQSSGQDMDAVIIRCDDLQAGLLQWNIAVAPGQIAGLHFNAYGGAFERIPAQCFPGGSLPRACSGSGH